MLGASILPSLYSREGGENCPGVATSHVLVRHFTFCLQQAQLRLARSAQKVWPTCSSCQLPLPGTSLS
jgi:hypothetical protein